MSGVPCRNCVQSDLLRPTAATCYGILRRLVTAYPKTPALYGVKKKRMGRDSNPRTPFDVSGFQDRCNKPLCHPSYFFAVPMNCKTFRLSDVSLMEKSLRGDPEIQFPKPNSCPNDNGPNRNSAPRFTSFFMAHAKSRGSLSGSSEPVRL